MRYELLDGRRCECKQIAMFIWIENKEKYLDSRKLYMSYVIFYALYCSILHLILSSCLYSFFQDGLKTADKLKQYIEKLATDLSNVSVNLLLQTVNLNPWFLYF
jgi:hypothetical protein